MRRAYFSTLCTTGLATSTGTSMNHWTGHLSHNLLSHQQGHKNWTLHCGNLRHGHADSLQLRHWSGPADHMRKPYGTSPALSAAWLTALGTGLPNTDLRWTRHRLDTLDHSSGCPTWRTRGGCWEAHWQWSRVAEEGRRSSLSKATEKLAHHNTDTSPLRAGARRADHSASPSPAQYESHRHQFACSRDSCGTDCCDESRRDTLHVDCVDRFCNMVVFLATFMADLPIRGAHSSGITLQPLCNVSAVTHNVVSPLGSFRPKSHI